MADKQPMKEALKRAIESSGLTFKALERETGVTRQSLMAFMKGERTLRLDMADRVADYFGLIVGPASKPKRKGK
jgi:transcriptional regulator with XRE-family HTH domain